MTTMKQAAPPTPARAGIGERTSATPNPSSERTGQAATMQAILQDHYGSPNVLALQEIDTPVIGDDGVLIRVHAAGIHSGDWHLMTGLPYLMRIMGFGLRAPKARIRGMDVAGLVETVGKNVTQFRAGDEVFGTCDGAFAEYAGARVDTLAPKPVNLTFEQAAAVPTSACTALQALRDAGGIKPKQKVLIIGASGGVGLFAVQIAKAFGADVTGVCSAPKMDTVRAIGADHVIDYNQVDFTRSGQQYDLILDMGGNRSLAQLRRVLTPRGTLVLVGGEGQGRWIGTVGRSIRALVMSPFVRQRLRMIFATTKTADLRFLAELIETAKIVPVIDRTYPLREVPDALRYLHEGHAQGKIVISVGRS